MKVALFGSTGFVGSYLVDTLIENKFIPKVLVRFGSEKKIRSECDIVSGDILDSKAVEKTICNTDAIIYNIGIIREFPSKGITYKKLHIEGLMKCIELAKKLKVNRFILMSANGVKESGTEYQKTKYLADELLKKSNLLWTIFRPSLIFGDPRRNDRPEFCTQLKKDMLSLPFPAPLFYNGLLPFEAGAFSMSPIHVKNVADFFVKAIKNESTFNKVYDLGGLEKINWKKIIHLIAMASKKNTWKVPAPIIFIKMVAYFLDKFSWFPVTRDQLVMLMEGNTVSQEYFNEFDIAPIAFELNNLKYLK